MSTQPYQTRSRARMAPSDHSTPNAKAAGLHRANSESSIATTVSTPPGEVTPRAASPAYSVDTPIRLYSDVVLTRIPSMPGALEATPTGEDKLVRPRIRQEVSARADTVETTPVTVDVSTENQRPKVAFDLHDESELSSSEQTDGTGDDQSPEWTDVKRKRGRNSPSRESSTQRATSELSREQDTLIKLAEDNLTEDDRKRIAARQRTLNIQRDRSLSREEGPSRDKGKAPDPANWGDLDLEDGEVDLDAQRATLESFRLAREREDTDLDEQREVSRSLDQTRDDSTPTADAADKSAFVPRAKAESAVKAVKDKLSKQYQSRIEELEARLALTEAHSRRKKQDKVNHPVEGMVDRVLERASSPLPSHATPQAMAPIQQVAPRSYVGRAMGMDKPKKSDHGPMVEISSTMTDGPGRILFLMEADGWAEIVGYNVDGYT
ncbi:hypothetical protein P692DRAFT_201852930 [Suillus brevipes Sb2]|nr:hypothetical protein P692DRAFT_201852930 [Suillus brevipes Sb2]